MDFDEHEDQEANDDMGMPIPTPNYDSLTNSATPKINSSTAQQPPPAATHHRRPVRYRECLKNHAVSIGGHAVDGCGEFIAAGEEGTLDALKCAACNCHRNFHRKEADGGGGGCQQQHQPQFSSYYRPPPPAGYLHLQSMPPHQPLALPSASGGVGGGGGDEDVSNPSSSGGSKKRFRTKFTAEQKEKMLEFAERLGWRIQKHDESAVAQFCEETGVKRQVLKVWMHNNKNTVGKKP